MYLYYQVLLLHSSNAGGDKRRATRSFVAWQQQIWAMVIYIYFLECPGLLHAFCTCFFMFPPPVSSLKVSSITRVVPFRACCTAATSWRIVLLRSPEMDRQRMVIMQQLFLMALAYPIFSGFPNNSRCINLQLGCHLPGSFELAIGLF